MNTMLGNTSYNTLDIERLCSVPLVMPSTVSTYIHHHSSIGKRSGCYTYISVLRHIYAYMPYKLGSVPECIYTQHTAKYYIIMGWGDDAPLSIP